MLAVIYKRVSTEDQAKGYSLESQEELCRAKANELGIDEVEVYSDDVSGAIFERPGITDARDRIKKGGVTHFICYDPDRFARNLSHQLIITEEIERAGVELVFVNFKWENTPEGRMFYAMRGAMAEFQKERTKQDSKRGKLKMARQGKLTHNPFKYGYDFDRDTKSLVINKEQEKTYLMMLQWSADGWGPNLIADNLNTMGIPGPKGGPWLKTTVKRILDDGSRLTGVMYLNKYNSEGAKHNKYRKEKIRIKLRPKEEWIPVNIPIIAPSDLWHWSQNTRAHNRHIKPGQAKREYILTGMLKCGECGRPMSGHGSKSRGRVFNYYRCVSCGKNIPAEKLEITVWGYAVKILQDPDGFIESRAEPKTQETTQVKARMAALNEERQRIMTLYRKGHIQEHELDKELSGINKQIENAEELINIFQAQQKKMALSISAKDIKALRNKYKEILDSPSPEQQRTALHFLNIHIVVCGKKEVELLLPQEFELFFAE